MYTIYTLTTYRHPPNYILYLYISKLFNRRWCVPPATWLPGERVQGLWSIEYIIRHYHTDLHGHRQIYLHLDTYTYLPRCIGVHGSEALASTCSLLIISLAPGIVLVYCIEQVCSRLSTYWSEQGGIDWAACLQGFWKQVGSAQVARSHGLVVIVVHGFVSAYALRMEGEAANAAEEDVLEVLGGLCVMEDAPHARRGWERMVAGVGKRLKRQPTLPCKVLGGSWTEEELDGGGVSATAALPVWWVPMEGEGGGGGVGSCEWKTLHRGCGTSSWGVRCCGF